MESNITNQEKPKKNVPSLSITQIFNCDQTSLFVSQQDTWGGGRTSL